MTIAKSVPEVYAKLGVRPVIHGSGTTTRYGGSLMRPGDDRGHARGLAGPRQPRRAQRGGGRRHRADARRRGRARHGRLDGRARAPGRRVHHRRRPRAHRAPARRHRAAQRVRHPARASLQLRPGLSRARRRPRRDRARAAHQAYELEDAIGERTAGVIYLVSPFTSPPGVLGVRGGLPDRARARRAGARRRGLDAAAAREPLPLPPRRRRSRDLQRRQGHPRAAEHRHPRGPAGPDPRGHAQREPEPGHRPRGEDLEGGDRRPGHGARAVPRRGRGGGDGAVPRGLARASSRRSRDIPGLRVVVEQDPVNRVIPHAVIYFEPEWTGPSAGRCSSRSRRASPTSTCSRARTRAATATRSRSIPSTSQPGDENVIVRRLREELTRR